jgi:2-oxoglutarate ferredoxin oxidoreductase subunit beta
VFANNRDNGIRRKPDGDIEVVQLGNGITEAHLLVHDMHHPRPYYAFTLAHMELRPGFPTPIGIFRWWPDVPRYEDVMNQQVQAVIAKRGPGDLDKLLHAGDTWEVR